MPKNLKVLTGDKKSLLIVSGSWSPETLKARKVDIFYFITIKRERKFARDHSCHFPLKAIIVQTFISTPLLR